MTELEAVGRRVKRRRTALQADTILLHRLVREARASGISLRAIAEGAGLSYGRIHQLTKGAADADDESNAGDHG